MISEKEKKIYNSHLFTSRSTKNKPTRFRNNFNNLAEKDEVCLKKLSAFLYRYNHINLSDWFIAPYEIYNEGDNYYDLHFYTTRKALKCYSMYMKKKETQDPDSDLSIKQIKACLSFIYKFCKDRNLTLAEYVRSNDGNLPQILTHLKQHKINFYTLHLLEVDAIIKSVETPILNFIISDFWNLYSKTRTKFTGSSILKHKARKGKQIIKTKLVENKQK